MDMTAISDAVQAAHDEVIAIEDPTERAETAMELATKYQNAAMDLVREAYTPG